MTSQKELFALFLEFQKTEVTEHAIYTALAGIITGVAAAHAPNNLLVQTDHFRGRQNNFFFSSPPHPSDKLLFTGR